MSLGYRHSLFLAENSEVIGAGLNRDFQLGLGDGHSKSNYYSPIKLHSLQAQNIKQIIAGGFSAAITSTDQILVWGQGEFGTFSSP